MGKKYVSYCFLHQGNVVNKSTCEKQFERFGSVGSVEFRAAEKLVMRTMVQESRPARRRQRRDHRVGYEVFPRGSTQVQTGRKTEIGVREGGTHVRHSPKGSPSCDSSGPVVEPVLSGCYSARPGRALDTGGRENWAGRQAALTAEHEPRQVPALPAAPMNEAASGRVAVGHREPGCIPAGRAVPGAPAWRGPCNVTRPSACLPLLAGTDAAGVRPEAGAAKRFAGRFLAGANHTFCPGQKGARERRLFRGWLFLSVSAASPSRRFSGRLDGSRHRGRRTTGLPTPTVHNGRKMGHGKAMAGKTIGVSFDPRGLSDTFLALLGGFFLSPLQSGFEVTAAHVTGVTADWGWGGGLSRQVPFQKQLQSLGSQCKARMWRADLHSFCRGRRGDKGSSSRGICLLWSPGMMETGRPGSLLRQARLSLNPAIGCSASQR